LLELCEWVDDEGISFVLRNIICNIRHDTPTFTFICVLYTYYIVILYNQLSNYSSFSTTVYELMLETDEVLHKL